MNLKKLIEGLVISLKGKLKGIFYCFTLILCVVLRYEGHVDNSYTQLYGHIICLIIHVA